MGCVQILIADDHELFRRTVRSFIEAQPDFRVCGEATDGLEAVEKVRELQPHIVLMDINMPRMDGLEATRIIRREYPDCNVIIVTQNHATIAREQARGVNAHGSITKSDLTKDLLPTIENVFRAAHPEARKHLTEESAPAQGEWVRGGGALGRLVQEFDWSKTPLGAIEHWPQSLKTVVRTMLTSRFAMWMSWGSELTFLYNDAYAKMTLGKKHPWALGKPSQKVWEEIWSDIGPRIESVLQSGNATWDEGLLLFLERSGYREETYHTFSYSPLAGDDGKVAGHLCVVTEETDRVIGERRLKTLRTLASELSKTTTEQDVVESIPRVLEENRQDLPFSLTYLFSDDGKAARLCCRTGVSAGHRVAPEVINLSSTNPTWPLTGLLEGRDSVVIDDLPARFPSIPMGAWDKSPERALLLPITCQTQSAPAGVLVAALNLYRPLDVSYAGFLNLIAGQIAASIANARAYEQEKKRAESLAELDSAKTAFFSNVSHEFRTPLTLMLAPLEDMLAEGDVLSPDQKERVDIAHRNSLRLLKLVNTLLDFSRIEAGRFQACYEPTDVSQLTSELASVFRSAIERAGLRFLVNAASIQESLYVDRELWEKIVFNLLSNAFKFTFEGEIEISIRKVDASVELAVRDTGTGIPDEDLPHIFERFYQVKAAHGRTFEGSGIGLALVQELAKLHGGAVRVESQVGRGSTFTVTIPLGKAHLPQDRIGAPRTLASTTLSGEAYVEELLHWLPDVEKESAASTALAFSGLDKLTLGERRARVLLADDNADMRDYVRKLLSSVCDVQTVPDGQAALDAVREEAPDIVVSDVMMPKLDGFGLLKELRSDKSTAGIPVILLSARAGEESRIEGLSSGADDYLTKPFSARELLARVKSQLNMARVRHESVELARATRLLAAIVDSSDDAILSKNIDGTINSWNKSAERLFGYSAEEAIGKHITLIVPWELRSEEEEILRRLARGERVEHFETVRRRKDGSTVDVSMTISPLHDSTGRVVGASNIARDITERKRIEQALQESERKYRDLAETASIALHWVAGDGTIIWANRAELELLGYSKDEYIGHNISEFHIDTPVLEDILERLSAGERIKEYEARLRTKDGSVRHVIIDSSVLFEHGKFIHTRCFTRDITARKRAEQALRESEQRYRVVTDASPVMVWMSGTDKLFYYFNKSWLDFVGHTMEQEIGNGWAQGVHPNDVERCVQVYESCFDARSQFEMEYRRRHHTGQYRWILDRGVPRFTADGTFEGYIGGCLDIHDRKEAAEKTRIADETLRLMRVQDQERRHIARELHDTAGQTLTVLGMSLAQVMDKVSRVAPEVSRDGEELKQLVGQLHQEIRTASYLLHPPLLDESGLATALRLYVDGLKERGVLDVTLNVSEDFGRLPPDTELAIFRVVQECLTNVHRHSGSKTATINLMRNKDTVDLEVRDQGKGVPPQRLAEIQMRSSGVGLSGMRERLAQCHGSMRIESNGSGTTVRATMPVPKQESVEPDAVQASA